MIKLARYILALKWALSVLILPAVGSAAGTTVYIDEGNPVNVKGDSGSWQRVGNYMQAQGASGQLSIGEQIATGDFRFAVVLKANSYIANPGSVLINEISSIGFGGANNSNKTFVKGFFFGDRTQTLKSRSDFFTDTEDFKLDISRIADIVNISINNKLLYSIPYESNRDFGKISFKEEGGKLSIRKAELISGNTKSLVGWRSPKSIDYPLIGKQVNVFSRGDGGGYHTYRIPAIIQSSNGTLLAFCEGRKFSPSDSGKIDLVMRRSTDGGKTWGALQVIHSESGDVTIGNPVPVLDKSNNNIWLAFCRNNERVFVTSSANNGETWRVPREITSSVKPDDWSNWYATGPGHGIQLKSGRLLIPANHGQSSHALWSDDHGATWQAGNPIGSGTNEVMMAERLNGMVYMNARNTKNLYNRKIAFSNNGGESWSAIRDEKALIEPICQGSLLTLDTTSSERLFLFCNPASVRRERLTVRLSMDEGTKWSEGFRLYEGSSAYSDMVSLDGNSIGVLYERDWYEYITFAIVDTGVLRASSIENWDEMEGLPKKDS